MIIPNSTITPISYVDTFDEYGFPLAASREEGKPMQAQCITITHNALSIVDKETHTAASYQILIEGEKFPFSRLLLQREGEEPKEYGVVKVEPLRAVFQVAIYV